MARLTENPFYQKALKFIEENDLQALPCGKHVIDEGNLWVNIVETNLRPVEQAKLEVHDEFIDIQIPFTCSESYGIKARMACDLPVGGMDKANDIMFFDDAIETIITKAPGQMTIFEPDIAHAPLIGEGVIRKAIFKVRVV